MKLKPATSQLSQHIPSNHPSVSPAALDHPWKISRVASSGTRKSLLPASWISLFLCKLAIINLRRQLDKKTKIIRFDEQTYASRANLIADVILDS